MNSTYLLIGGNMGNREMYLFAAREKIQNLCGDIVSQSSIYQTAAWGMEEQEPFLNQVIKLSTGLTPMELLQTILRIEENIGRKREVKYGPRIIDIDILFYDDVIIQRDNLTIPHPQLQNRRFVPEPLNEIGGHLVHPVFQKTVLELLKECSDNLTVQKFQ